jgi:hypothetical protein
MHPLTQIEISRRSADEIREQQLALRAARLAPAPAIPPRRSPVRVIRRILGWRVA